MEGAVASDRRPLQTRDQITRMRRGLFICDIQVKIVIHAYVTWLIPI